jgi:hypothetical protein
VSKKIEDMVPAMVDRYKAFDAKMIAVKLAYMITCTARSFKVQMALYAQGRQPFADILSLRNINVILFPKNI